MLLANGGRLSATDWVRRPLGLDQPGSLPVRASCTMLTRGLGLSCAKRRRLLRLSRASDAANRQKHARHTPPLRKRGRAKPISSGCTSLPPPSLLRSVHVLRRRQLCGPSRCPGSMICGRCLAPLRLDTSVPDASSCNLSRCDTHVGGRKRPGGLWRLYGLSMASLWAPATA